jgi:hypothetical protein
MPLMSSG